MSRPQKIALVLFCIAAMVAPLLLYQSRHTAPKPEIMGQLPPWSLTDQDGEPFGSKQLAGRPYLVSFFFTSCPSICPKIMAAMRRVQDETLVLKLVSISVDHEHDTPQVLRDASARYGVKADRWTLCTGSEEAIKKVVVGGFKTYVGQKKVASAGVYDIAHGARLVLVDSKGQVRGHFATDNEGHAALKQAIDALR